LAPDKPLTIICASVEPFNSPWLLHQPLNIHYSKDHPVMYVMDEPSLDQVIRSESRRQLPPSGFTKEADNIFQLRTSWLFPRFFFSKVVDDLSLRFRAWQIRRTVKKQGWDNSILYFWQPRFRELIGRVGARLTVFHSHDYYPGFLPEGTQARKDMEVLYDQAMRDSDVVVACGKLLYDDAVEARGGPEGVHLVENGVSFDLLTSSAGKGLPKEFEGLQRPIVAYIGRINKTVNLRILAEIAVARPNWTVVVMGPRTGWSDSQEKAFKRLSALPNFRYVEGKPMNGLGAYMSAIDVGLISYENDGIMDFRFPLKMVEYFAFGLPVVSVKLPSIERFKPLVRMVESDAEWVPAIEAALAENNPEFRTKRIAISKSMDWSEKAREVIEIIRARLKA